MFKRISQIVVLVIVLLTGQKVKAQVALLDSLTLDTLTGYTNLQEALKNPDAVTKLVLRKQHLKSFPGEIFLFKNLQYLDLSKNDIKEIPDSIGTLTNLQYFLCFKSGLERLSKGIGQLNNLLYLNLNQNELEYLPPQIGNLEKLEILDLWSNNLAEYPPSLANLKSLRVLDLRAILMTDELQAQVEGMLPRAKVYMSPSCKCKW
ncbi:MAG: leucine-rich repeat domain-containing protein [Bacteroidota bacterium]